MTINAMDLRSFDLNLLVILNTLLTEQSVSRTAKQLNLSQPAVSAALNRLRKTLNDPILVRDGSKMVPTARAEQFAIPVQSILADIEATFAALAPFDAKTAKRKFRIATKDYGAYVFIPELMQRIESKAPGIDLEVWDTGQSVEKSLQSGDIDLAITDAWELRHCRCVEELFKETFTCLIQKNHPRIGSTITIEQYVQEQHALISIRGRVPGNVDVALKKLNLQRHVRLTLPHVLSAPAVVASTELIVTMASRIAAQIAERSTLRALPPPVELNGFDIAMAWHPRLSEDAALQWLQEEVRQVSNTICARRRSA